MNGEGGRQVASKFANHILITAPVTFLKIRNLYFLNVRSIYDSLVMLISEMAPECTPGPELFLTQVARDGDAFDVIGLNMVLD